MSDIGVRGEEARLQAQQMFRRVLASWASDALALRRAGLDRPSLRLVGTAADQQPLRRAA